MRDPHCLYMYVSMCTSVIPKLVVNYCLTYSYRIIIKKYVVYFEKLYLYFAVIDYLVIHEYFWDEEFHYLQVNYYPHLL